MNSLGDLIGCGPKTISSYLILPAGVDVDRVSEEICKIQPYVALKIGQHVLKSLSLGDMLDQVSHYFQIIQPMSIFSNSFSLF